MPYYDYDCADCGAFTETRPMAQSGEPCACPSCGMLASRAFFTTPFVASMEPAARRAIGVNEQAAHAPKRSKELGHGPGCGCCGPKPTSKTLYRADGAKSFPAGRPWMISH